MQRVPRKGRGSTVSDIIYTISYLPIYPSIHKLILTLFEAHIVYYYMKIRALPALLAILFLVTKFNPYSAL